MLQSVDELLMLAEQQSAEKEYCTVDDDTRVVTVPETYKMLGVESDKKAKRIWFKFPKLVGNNGLNLMELNIRINYRNAAGDGDIYIVTDKKEESDSVIFSWELSRNVTKQKGKVQFVVCAIKTKTDGSITNEWNTKLNSECESLEGLETKQEIEKENPEVIEYILANLGGTVTQEQIAEALKEYFTEHPIEVPKKLSELQDDAEHRTVTDAEKKSWDNKSGTGLSDIAKNLLITILKNAVYTVNQKTNIEALENALSTQNTPTDAWSIVQNLTYVTSTNTAFNVKKGESYTTTIVPNTNYMIDSVTVVMGGVDITNTAYNNGVITINSVTGNVIITAIAKKNSGALLPSDGLLANFDFRNKEMTSYNLSGWGNVYKCDDETGNYFTFGGSAKTASQGGIEQYVFRDVRKKDNESKSVDLGTDFTIAMYSTEVPNILNSAKKSNVSVAKIILAPRYINTSASEVITGQTELGISRDKYMSLIITVSASVIKMYVDGTLQKTYNGEEISGFKKWKSTPVQPLTVYNEGTIASAAMYNKALSDNDVTELHAYFKALEVE